MKIRLVLYLARKYLIAKWSLMSTLSILMIAFGVITLITVLSIMNGFHNTFRRKILETNTYHVIVQSYDVSSQADGEEEILKDRIELISENDDVMTVVPYFNGEGIINSTYVTRGVVLKSLPSDILKIDRGFEREIRVTQGAFDLEGKNIVLGEELARDAGVEVGEYLTVLTLKAGDLTASQPQFNIFRSPAISKPGIGNTTRTWPTFPSNPPFGYSVSTGGTSPWG